MNKIDYNELQLYRNSMLERRLSVSTIAKRLSLLSKYHDYIQSKNLTIYEVTSVDAHEFLLRYSKHKVSTFNSYSAMIKQFHIFLEERNLIKKPCSHLIKFKPDSYPLPRNIPKEDLIKLCQPTAKEMERMDSIITLRNQAIIEFLVSTGVRCAELRNCKLKMLSNDLSECFIITRKRGVNRTVYLGQYAVEALQNYLQKRKLSGSSGNEPLFLSTHKRQLSAGGLKVILEKLSLTRLGYPVSTNVIRHSFATEMLRSAGCLRSVQKLMGHAKITSTVRYCHLDISDMKRAIEQYHPRS